MLTFDFFCFTVSDSDSSLENFNKRVDDEDVNMNEPISPLKVGTALRRRSKLGQMKTNLDNPLV